MTEKQDMGVVTAADREAATGILYCAVPNSFTADGQYKLDMELVAQAFRDHRLASQADQGEAYRGFQSAVAALRSWAAGFAADGGPAKTLRAAALDLEKNRDAILATHPQPSQKGEGDA